MIHLQHHQMVNANAFKASSALGLALELNQLETKKLPHYKTQFYTLKIETNYSSTFFRGTKLPVHLIFVCQVACRFLLASKYR